MIGAEINPKKPIPNAPTVLKLCAQNKAMGIIGKDVSHVIPPISNTEIIVFIPR